MLWPTTIIKGQRSNSKEKRKVCTYLVKILPFSPTASPTALLSVSRLGSPWLPTFLTGPWCDLRLSLVLADSWLVCLPSWVCSLLSTSSELMERTGLELSQCKITKTSKSFLHCLLWRFAELQNVIGPTCKWTAGN